MKKRLRRNQRNFMDTLIDYWLENQHPPSDKELSVGTGLDLRSITRTKMQLRDEGYILFKPKQARTTVPVGLILDFSEVEALQDDISEED